MLLDDEPFRLENSKPRLKPARFENSDRRRQGMLLSGLDCLPGQQDLFEGVDSQAKESETFEF